MDRFRVAKGVARGSPHDSGFSQVPKAGNIVDLLKAERKQIADAAFTLDALCLKSVKCVAFAMHRPSTCTCMGKGRKTGRV